MSAAVIVAAGCTSSNLILISLLYRDCLRGAEWEEPAFPWTNTSSKTGPGIVSVTSRTRHPVIRSNEDDCQLSTCAGLMIFSFGTGDAGMAAGVRLAGAATRSWGWRLPAACVCGD